MGDPPAEPPELSGTGLTLSGRSKDREELATILRVREPVGACCSVSTMLILGFWRERKREMGEKERERDGRER